jgi:hypothetical protein
MMSERNKHISIVIPAQAGIQKRARHVSHVKHDASYDSYDGQTAFWMPDQVRHDRGYEE